MPVRDSTIPWQNRANAHAISMQKMWRSASDRAKDEWDLLAERQAFYDCLSSMKHHGLIKDFDLNGITFYAEGE